MAKLSQLVAAADSWLAIDEIPDYPPAFNGLQVENATGEVRRIAAAVDACLPVIERACDAGADLLVVHHGLFWTEERRLTGSAFRKLKLAFDHGLAIYSAHIPLDVHSELGNNARLLAALEIEGARPFFPWKGIELGLEASGGWDREDLVKRVAQAVNAPVHLCPGGPERVSRLGVITGGAGGEIHGIAGTGVDTFLTGEGPHWSYTAAEELGINLIYAGHYATETFGVKALAEQWCAEFEGLEWDFLDHPTGL